MPLGLTVALLLVAAGVTTTLAVARSAGSPRSVVGIGAAAAVLVVATYVLAAGTDEVLVPSYYDDGWLNVAWFTAPAVLALACAWASGVARPSSPPAWVATIVVFVPLLAVVGAVGVFLAAALEGALRAYAHRGYSGIPTLVAGALAGGLLALVAVLPRARAARAPQPVHA
jgi:hypothetical protein